MYTLLNLMPSSGFLTNDIEQAAAGGAEAGGVVFKRGDTF